MEQKKKKESLLKKQDLNTIGSKTDKAPVLKSMIMFRYHHTLCLRHFITIMNLVTTVDYFFIRRTMNTLRLSERLGVRSIIATTLSPNRKRFQQ